jgi:uncharacterized protein
MKWLRRLFSFGLIAGAAAFVYRTLKQSRQDSAFELAPVANQAALPGGGQRRGISPELLEILADPGDKGPVELVTDANGAEWLVNRRNGYRYPIEDGIPIMLLEEGEKNRDESLIAA